MMKLAGLSLGLVIWCQAAGLGAAGAGAEELQAYAAAPTGTRLVAQTPAAQTPAAQTPAARTLEVRTLLAQKLLAIEQLEAVFVTLGEATVQQRPTAESEPLAVLAADSLLRVTGLVTGHNWYRVITDEGGVGYVDGRSIRPATAEPEPPGGRGDPQSAALRAPRPPVATGSADRAEATFRDCPRCPQMVRLPPGRFTMGSAAGDASERPPREVIIGSAFAVGQYEVTVAEWRDCVAAGGCGYEPKPVADPARTALRNVSWDDARQYVDWLSKRTGKPYRLPSEAEWEYAMRGGAGTAYPWGERMELGRASCKDCGGAWDRKAPAAVGSYAANPFGLHDLAGGVAEWTADCWFKDHRGRPGDGAARDKRGCQQRVLRGGSWCDDASYLRSASRLSYDASVRYVVNGFRVAVTLE